MLHNRYETIGINRLIGSPFQCYKYPVETDVNNGYGTKYPKDQAEEAIKQREK